MIGQLLKQERNKVGISQKELGNKAGVSYVAINRIEKGLLPRVSVATKLFNALGLQLKFYVEPTQGEGALS